MVRVSERFRYDTTNNRMQNVRQDADRTHEIAISGKKILNLSDDPVGAVRVLRNRNKLENINQYRKTIDFGKGFLSKTEESLRSINDSLIRVKELAIQQSNATWDGQTRAVVSQEVRQIMDQVVALGNSTYGDRYVFGGFRTSSPPLASDGSYLGDDGLIYLQFDEDNFSPINLPGREIFDVSSDNYNQDNVPLIKNLKDIYIALKDNNSDLLHQSMAQLDKNTNRLISQTAVLGSRMTGIADIEKRLDHTEELLLIDNNNIEAADPVKSAMDVQRMQATLQSTLAASEKALTPSLMSFLK